MTSSGASRLSDPIDTEGATTMNAEAQAVSYRAFSGNAAENYERYFVPTIGAAFGDALLEVARPQRGERVLDVACGTGGVTRRIAAAVGEDGHVSGLDLNPTMLAVAQKACGDASIDWYEASAESIPLPDASFDLVTCSLGLQFVADKIAAVTEMNRVLVDGGRLVVGTVPPIPAFEIFEDAIARHVGPEVAAFMAQVFSLGDPEELRALFEAAGSSDVCVETTSRPIELPAPAEFLWQYVNLTPLGAVFAELEEDRRASFEHDVVSAWEPFVRDGRLVMEPVAVLTTGRR
jgi:ubiquinone/menaquinone biosynthesis C-methylase UbiE